MLQSASSIQTAPTTFCTGSAKILSREVEKTIGWTVFSLSRYRFVQVALRFVHPPRVQAIAGCILHYLRALLL